MSHLILRNETSACHSVSVFLLEFVLRILKVPTLANLTYNCFEVSFSTASIPWNDASVVGELVDEDSEQDRNFEMMPAPSNAALHK